MSSSSIKCPQPEAGSGGVCCLPHTTPEHHVLFTEKIEHSRAPSEPKPPHPKKLGTSLILTSPGGKGRHSKRGVGQPTLQNSDRQEPSVCGSACVPSTTLHPRAPKGGQQSLSPGQITKLNLNPAALFPESFSPTALWLPQREFTGDRALLQPRENPSLEFAAQVETVIKIVSMSKEK